MFLDAGMAESRGSPNAAAKSKAIMNEDDEEFEDEHPLLEPFTQLSVDLQGRPSTSESIKMQRCL